MINYQDRKILGLFSLVSIIALTWLFNSFLLVLIFAAVYAIGTYKVFKLLSHKWSLTVSALLMCLMTFLFIIIPLVYLISAGAISLSVELPSFLAKIQSIDFQIFEQKLNLMIDKLPLLDSFSSQKSHHLINFSAQLKSLIIYSSQVLINLPSLVLGSFSRIFSLVLFLFILFFFYKDGQKIAKTIKDLLPTSKKLSLKIANLFESLCFIYLINVVVLALIQGLGFGIVTGIVNLPATYLGLLFLLSSFIPIIGTVLIWLPTSIYLFISGQDGAAVLIILYAVVVSGGIIDYYLRAQIINKLAQYFPKQNLTQSSLVVILSTLAGVIEFGVLGLILGPLVASSALSLINFYLQTKQDSKDDKNNY